MALTPRLITYTIGDREPETVIVRAPNATIGLRAAADAIEVRNRVRILSAETLTAKQEQAYHARTDHRSQP